MSGGKQTTETTIPQWMQDASQQGLARANTTAQIGYTPYYGPDVAAMTPMQEAAATNINAGASAFGLAAPASSGMPEAQTFAGGVRGYSSAPMYDAAISELKTRYPGQYNAIMAQFIDPVTGAAPQGVYGSAPQMGMQDVVSPATGVGSSGSSSGYGGGYGGNGFASTPLGARLPGGVNTRNPASAINQAIARATQTNNTPTQADRPKPNPRRP